MTNAAQGDGVTLADGWYRQTNDDKEYGHAWRVEIVWIENGVVSDTLHDTEVEYRMANGFKYEPVHVLTQAEYDALIQERDEWRREARGAARALAQRTSEKFLALLPLWVRDCAAEYDSLVAERDQLRDGICPDCDGEGAIDSGGENPWGGSIDIGCARCNGTGMIDERKEIARLAQQLADAQGERDQLRRFRDDDTVAYVLQVNSLIAERDALRQEVDTAAHNNSVLNAEIVALRQQVADMAGWETVPLGEYADENGKVLELFEDETVLCIRLTIFNPRYDSYGHYEAIWQVPDNWRLQRKRTESEGE